ncbi:MAG: DNA mismatch repair protein MutS [Simkaniaceae bacterium]|nr:DNA mismatch repair protein MutS [Simkaniaceae bacterium]
MTQQLSPMMAQWYACKKKAADALVLFRLGDFYEAFHDDAKILSKELSLTLTKRHGIPMSGIPAHTCESYVEKMVAKGYLIAIAEQVEDAKKAKGLVKRDIVRTISPGTIQTAGYLREKSNNYFACFIHINRIFAISFLDLSTGDFRVIEVETKREVLDEFCLKKPTEILIPEKSPKEFLDLLEELKTHFSFRLNIKDRWVFDHQAAHDFLTKHFSVQSLDGFGLSGLSGSINASGALLSYVSEDLSQPIDHIRRITKENLASYMAIDRITQKNLELIESLQNPSGEHTLLHLLDETCTPMGARLLKLWVTHPLLCPKKIQMRQEVVEKLLEKPDMREASITHLKLVKDLERLITRIATGYTTPRDLTAISQSLQHVEPLKNLMLELCIPNMSKLIEKLTDVSDIIHLINNAIVETPPLKVTDGDIFKEGYHEELDELRGLRKNSQTWIANYQTSLKEATGIKNLKISYSRAFGYFIEVSKGQASLMPETFQRRQTLVNAERFISEELKTYEDKILNAEDRITSLEHELYQKIREKVAAHINQIHQIAKALAHFDALLSLSLVASYHGYIKPIINNSDALEIQDGRHPVIDAFLRDQSFIPNDTLFDKDRLLLITGPNMAGKSTYIRQVALITIMAQIGSFVPAKSAKIGIVDKVFSRIGASDDISRGQSTFMMEMTETANILNNHTAKSLIILDEIGRGTSTYDGISIAWAVAEFLLKSHNPAPKTLFATHYFELTGLEKEFKEAANFNVAVKESNDTIVFLRKIVRGSADKSYGVHVGRLAGLPSSVIKRSLEMLETYEKSPRRKKPAAKIKADQLTFLNPKQENVVESNLRKLNLDQLSPIEALQKLFEWKKDLA